MKRIGLVLIALLLPSFISCKRNDGCMEELTQKIPVGSPQDGAEQVLKRCGYTYSFDQKTSTIYGLKRGEKKGLVMQSWSVQIKLDGAHRVTSVKVEKAFTGP